MSLALEELIVTQHHLRIPWEEIEGMARFVADGGLWTPSYLEEYALAKGIRRSPLIQVSVFEDSKKFLHDGHHRAVATHLGGRSLLDDCEYEVKDWTYAEYLEINFAAGWVTPFDPRTQVRHADFYRWKKAIQQVALSDQAEACRMIEEQRSSYLMPRKYNSVSSLAVEVMVAKGGDDATSRCLKNPALRQRQGVEH